MPPGNGWSELVRIVVGRRGTVRMKMELVLRFDYGFSIPWVSRLKHDSGIKAIVGPDTAVLRTPVELRGENMHTVAEFTVSEGERVPFSLAYSPSHLRIPPAPRSAHAARTHREPLARVVGAQHGRRQVCRADPPLADHAEGARLRADRRHRRRAHHLAARTAGRHAQLGLPLLLAARRHHHAARHDARRLLRRSARVAQLARPRDGRRARSVADHVRASPASGACRSWRSTGCRATRARSPCASATTRSASSSSTSTAK